MKTNVTQSDFIDAFKQSDTRENQFSYEALKALYEYFEEYEESTGDEIEFDMIAICCEYTEYEDLKELQASYPNIEDMQDLENSTQVIPIEGTEGFIIQDF